MRISVRLTRVQNERADNQNKLLMCICCSFASRPSGLPGDVTFRTRHSHSLRARPSVPCRQSHTSVRLAPFPTYKNKQPRSRQVRDALRDIRAEDVITFIVLVFITALLISVLINAVKFNVLTCKQQKCLWFYLYSTYTDIMTVMTGPLNNLSSFTVVF